VTNAQIAAMPFFVAACSVLKVEPTKRQVRKAKQGAGQWVSHPLVKTLQNMNAQPAKEAA
jgi:hypothetical protein|tara:strand:- start:383 stop:562 length:180 start_codon:yes stop_codon:yes gene_type:complete